MGLFAIHFQTEFALYPFRNGMHYPVRARAAPHRYYAVIGITNPVKTSPFKLLVKFVEHHVAQQGRQISPLRCAYFGSRIYPVFHYSRFQILAYQALGVRVSDYSANVAHQLVLWNIVEEFLQVYVHYPFTSLIEVFRQFPNGLLAAPARAEAVAVFLKFRLTYVSAPIVVGYHSGTYIFDKRYKVFSPSP